MWILLIKALKLISSAKFGKFQTQKNKKRISIYFILIILTRSRVQNLSHIDESHLTGSYDLLLRHLLPKHVSLKTWPYGAARFVLSRIYIRSSDNIDAAMLCDNSRHMASQTKPGQHLHSTFDRDRWFIGRWILVLVLLLDLLDRWYECANRRRDHNNTIEFYNYFTRLLNYTYIYIFLWFFIYLFLIFDFFHI